MKHLVIAGILSSRYSFVDFWNGVRSTAAVAASLQAVPIDWMFDLEFKVIAFLFALIVVLMVLQHCGLSAQAWRYH